MLESNLLNHDMTVLSLGSLKIDHTDDGSGPSVVLIHSSVSANRQWRALCDALKNRYRVIAVNLYGYGETTPWPGTVTRKLTVVTDGNGFPKVSRLSPKLTVK